MPGGCIGLAGADPASVMMPADRVLLSVLERNAGVAPVAEIKAALVASGLGAKVVGSLEPTPSDAAGSTATTARPADPGIPRAAGSGW